jgi:hypothetical protein
MQAEMRDGTTKTEVAFIIIIVAAATAAARLAGEINITDVELIRSRVATHGRLAARSSKLASPQRGGALTRAGPVPAARQCFIHVSGRRRRHEPRDSSRRPPECAHRLARTQTHGPPSMEHLNMILSGGGGSPAQTGRGVTCDPAIMQPWRRPAGEEWRATLASSKVSQRA